MKVRNWIIGSVAAAGIGICAIGGFGYNYIAKMNKELNTYVLPNTTFAGISLDGKTKNEVAKIIQQKMDSLNQQSITYSLRGTNSTYTWKDLGVQYKGTDIADEIFKEQKGSILERYTLRQQAAEGELQRSYELTAQLDEKKYEEFMKEKYNDLLSQPKNASISISGTNVSISPSVDGEKVDKEKLKALTEEAVSKTIASVDVPLTAAKPERTTEDVQNMGINEVIAEYRSPMTGRNVNQTYNVSRAANKLTGVFIAPDEVFSFNGHVGLTNAANGYKLAGVYVNGKLEQEAGGGVCQVSSTLYGAILRADLTIVERSNHSKPVSYVPLGQDATIADYGPDLKFKNNTGHHIYIQSFVDGANTVVRVFGTSTGKSVTVSSKVISQTSKNVTVATYKTVKQNGQVIESRQISQSRYKKTA